MPEKLKDYIFTCSYSAYKLPRAVGLFLYNVIDPFY
jgi:hypothetical protein